MKPRTIVIAIVAVLALCCLCGVALLVGQLLLESSGFTLV